MKRVIPLLTGAVVLAGSVASAPLANADQPAPISYSVTLLKPLNDKGKHMTAQALGLNDRGDVVGMSFDEREIRVDGGGDAVIWRAGRYKAQEIKTNFGSSSAEDIDANQNILLLEYYTGESAHLMVNGKLREVAPRSFQRNFVLSESGTVAASGESGSTMSPYRPYTTDRSGRKVMLPAKAGDDVLGISPNGSRVVGRTSKGLELWTGGRVSRLALPKGVHIDSVYRAGVNDKGVVVACLSDEVTVRWDANGKRTQIPGEACMPHINNRGDVAGGAQVHIDGKTHSLNNLVPGRKGYTLGSVEDINASGQVVGSATLSNGQSVGYIATPHRKVNGTTVYTTPGTHQLNGRTWRTTCEPYSQTTRCRTDIWSTRPVVKNGRYVNATGWVFNNLTYLPETTRAQWGTNPLARTGNFTSSGRQWRTECDTPATGRNGCRSYIWGTYIKVTKTSKGTTYTPTNTWVFNNIVRFKVK